MREITAKTVLKLLRELALIFRRDHNNLKERINKLEGRFNKLEGHRNRTATTPPDDQ